MKLYLVAGEASGDSRGVELMRALLEPHGIAVSPAIEGAMKDAVSQFWNNDKITVADAMKTIASAAKTK